MTIPLVLSGLHLSIVLSVEASIIEDLIYVKETAGRGLGVFAVRDMLKDEIIAEFNGPAIKIEKMEGIPQEVWDHLLNVGVNDYLIGNYKDLPDEIKKKYENYTPDWIKSA